MHARTEDLLSLRDGEPVDAALRARLLADPAAMAEVERLRGMQRALRELPELAPPPDAWLAIAARCEAELPPRRLPFAQWLAGAAIAASVAFVAVLLVSGSFDSGESGAPPVQIVGADPESRPLIRPLIQPEYASLVEESARLERVLAQLPRRARMRAGTASTIAGLEDRIAVVDAQLTIGSARGVPVEQKQALFRERVDLMNALVHVRYAQTADGGF